MVDVFISYSRTDHARVAVLARAVEAEGYDVWWDADLPPHQSYGDVITAKISAARAAIVVWSADAVKSEWVRAEADMARNQKKLVQTAVGGVMPPLPFNQIQFAEIGDWQGELDHPGWRKVRASLAELCGKGADPRAYHAPVSPPPRPDPMPTASRWPLVAGGGVAVAALAVAGGVLMSRNGAPAPQQGAAPVVQPTVYVTETAREAPPPAPAGATPAPLPAAGAPRTDEPLPGPPPAGARVYFPDSSVRVLDPGEFAGLSRLQLRIARNEIFAREGRAFKDPSLVAYFSQFAWYRPQGFIVRLNAIEQQNVAALTQAEETTR